MNSPRRSTELFLRPQNDYYELRPESQSESQPESRGPLAHSPSPPLPQDPPTIGSSISTTKLLMIWPFVAHFIGSIAIAICVSRILDGRQYYLERQPRIQLANGTYESEILGKNHLLQSDITTIISVSLMVVRWTAGAWAVPLCWRAIFLLAGRSGLRRRDIDWVVNYAILPPATHFKGHLNPLMGLILIFTLAPTPSSPLLTGSISWLPSSLTVDLPYHPNLNFTGTKLDAPQYSFTYSPQYEATFSTDVVKNLNTAWTQDIQEGIFKRVVPSATRMPTNSTIDNVVIPYFAIPRIEWLSKMSDDVAQLFEVMRRDQVNCPRLSEKMYQTGAATLIVNFTHLDQMTDPLAIPTSWPVLINVGREVFTGIVGDCNPTTTILPRNSTISSFYLSLNATEPHQTSTRLDGCFAYANVSFDAALGLCPNCRVSSYSTVQNSTELLPIALSDIRSKSDFYYMLVRRVLRDMPQYIPNMTPLKNSLPDPADDLQVYTTALLTRLYSALWNSWIDSTGYYIGGPNSVYKPAIPTLRADINQARVYAWLALQLVFTLAGLAFIWLQSRSIYPLITDTAMVAFDIDSTEVPKPSLSNTDETNALLQVEPRGDGWKFVVTN